MDSLLQYLIQHGIAGIMLAIVIYAYWKKDLDYKSECHHRLDDQKNYSEKLLNVIIKFQEFTDHVKDHMEKIEKLIKRQD